MPHFIARYRANSISMRRWETCVLDVGRSFQYYLLAVILGFYFKEKQSTVIILLGSQMLVFNDLLLIFSGIYLLYIT